MLWIMISLGVLIVISMIFPPPLGGCEAMAPWEIEEMIERERIERKRQ